MNIDPIQAHLTTWLEQSNIPTSIQQVKFLPLALGSDVGLVRKENQDRVAAIRLLKPNDSAFVCLLCDGMGGMADGAVCAELAISAFLNMFVSDHAKKLEHRLLNAVDCANIAVHENYKGLGGSTLSGFAIDNTGKVLGVNVGDSRIYTAYRGELIQESKDDTLAGQVPLGSDENDRRNELLQYVGMGKEIEPNIIELPPIDVIEKILLTSDGLHFVGNAPLQAIVKNGRSEGTSIARLLTLSKWFGGHDNASIVLASNLVELLPKYSKDKTHTIEIWDNNSGIALFGISPDREKASNQLQSEQQLNPSLPLFKSTEKLIQSSRDGEISSKPDTVPATSIKKKKRSYKRKSAKKKPDVQIKLDG